jgi:hypothetical protein
LTDSEFEIMPGGKFKIMTATEGRRCNVPNA